MPRRPTQAIIDHVSRTILNTLAEVFAEPDFDNDGGEVRFLERSGDHVQLGLFPVDDEGEPAADGPTDVWTIKVHHQTP